MTNHEVLIIGAGPTGLMMACQLAIHKIPFRIIDKNEDHTKQSRALAIHARSLEIFEQMGISLEAVQQGKIAKGINLFVNGKRSLRFNLNNIGAGQTQFPFILILEQSKTEKLLNEFINRYGYFVERSTELLDFSQDRNEIIATLKQKDKAQETIQANWLIGADGANSIVRKKLDISFSGNTYKESLFVLDCETSLNIPTNEMCVCFSEKTFNLFFPMANERTRVIGIVPEEFQHHETISFEEATNDFAKRTRFNVTFKNPEWISLYHSHHRCVSTFRKGHCFLAGDAAHIHSPVGAQGMNTGLQDAYNLAWKLALVIHEKAKESLLDTYNDERIVIARNLVKTTDRVFNFITSQKRFTTFFRIYFLPGFLRLVLPIVQKISFIPKAAFKIISEIGLHYRFSKLSKNNCDVDFPDKAPKPGDRVPFLSEIQPMLSGNKFHLFIFNDDQKDNKTNQKLQKINKRYNDLITMHEFQINKSTKAIYTKFGISKPGYYFIRPDNYVAFRNNSLEFQPINEYMDLLFQE